MYIENSMYIDNQLLQTSVVKQNSKTNEYIESWRGRFWDQKIMMRRYYGFFLIIGSYLMKEFSAWIIAAFIFLLYEDIYVEVNLQTDVSKLKWKIMLTYFKNL